MIIRACDDGVCGGNGRDDVLDYALREGPRHALNIELLGPSQCRVVQPAYILWTVRIHLFVCRNVMATRAYKARWTYRHAREATLTQRPILCNVPVAAECLQWCKSEIRWACSACRGNIHNRRLQLAR